MKTSRTSAVKGSNGHESAAPIMHQRAKETQKFGTVVPMPIGLEEKICLKSVNVLNQILADTICLRDIYKKHHWQLSGHTFYSLHLLFDKHYEEQADLADAVAERIQSLGGVSIAMGGDVAKMTKIEAVPMGREEVPVQISRILEAHELILKEARKAAEAADDDGDDGTNDLLASQIIRTNELQSWFVAQHVVNTPLVQAD